MTSQVLVRCFNHPFPFGGYHLNPVVDSSSWIQLESKKYILPLVELQQGGRVEHQPDHWKLFCFWEIHLFGIDVKISPFLSHQVIYTTVCLEVLQHESGGSRGGIFECQVNDNSCSWGIIGRHVFHEIQSHIRNPGWISVKNPWSWLS